MTNNAASSFFIFFTLHNCCWQLWCSENGIRGIIQESNYTFFPFKLVDKLLAGDLTICFALYILAFVGFCVATMVISFKIFQGKKSSFFEEWEEKSGENFSSRLRWDDDALLSKNTSPDFFIHFHHLKLRWVLSSFFAGEYAVKSLSLQPF